MSVVASSWFNSLLLVFQHKLSPETTAGWFMSRFIHSVCARREKMLGRWWADGNTHQFVVRNITCNVASVDHVDIRMENQNLAH